MSGPPSTPVERAAKDEADLGPAICKRIYAATKLGGLWGYDSKVAQEAIAGLLAALRDNGARHGETTLRIASEQIFVNEQRLRMDFAGFLAFRYVLEFFSTREIGEIRVGGNPSERDVVGLLRALNGVSRDSDNPRETVEKALAQHGVADVDVSPPRDLDDGEEERQVAGIRVASIDSYFRAIYVARQILGSDAAGGAVEVRKAKRVIHGLADLLERDEVTLLSLVQIKNFGEHDATHAVNVAVLSMTMARRLGVPKSLLGEIGVAAMLHDAGRTALEDGDTSGTRGAGHVRRGARLLLSNMGFSDGSLRMVLGARHHHDMAVRKDGRLSPLLHRILRTADFYDCATTPAGEGMRAHLGRKVLRLMLRDSTRFDGRLVKLLAEVVGQFPLGTVVSLDTGERAVVCGRNPHFDSPTRPIVRVLTDDEEDGGAADAEPRTIDLSKWDREKKRFAHSIADSQAPAEAYASPADYIKTI